MSTTLTNTGISFPDSTTQTSAAITNSNIPVFQAYYSGTRTISSGTYTRQIFNTINFDSHSAWNSGSNYYSVPITGYYQINASTYVYYSGYYLQAALTTINTNTGTQVQSGQTNGYTPSGYAGAILNWSGNVDALLYLTAGTQVYSQTLGLLFSTGTVYNTGSYLNIYYVRS